MSHRALAFSALLLASGCQYVATHSVEQEATVKVPRDADAFTLEMRATMDARRPAEDHEFPANASLTVQVTTESRGFLGLFITDTEAAAWLEDLDGNALTEPEAWWVDGDANSAFVRLDDVFQGCETACERELLLVTEFADEDARVRVDVNATLDVFYDTFVGRPLTQLDVFAP